MGQFPVRLYDPVNEYISAELNKRYGSQILPVDYLRSIESTSILHLRWSRFGSGLST